MAKAEKVGWGIGYGAVVLLLIFCILASGALPVVASESEKVKVGFFNFEGYHIMDEDGQRSGYGYEYLQQMAKYADFVYEYIGYEDSWSQMQEMLEKGEIDILTSVQKTEARLKKYDFSEKPQGTSSTILTVKAGNTQYMTNDYEKLEGIRVGMLEGNSRNSSFEEFALENQFTFEPVYFEDNASLIAALQSGIEVDAAVTSNLRKIEKEWIVASFHPSPFYICVKKGNQALLDKVDYAMEQMEKDSPSLQAELFNQYYSANSGDEIAYTAEERAYIDRMKAEGKPLRVLMNPDREPMSYFQDGEPRGIIPVITKEVMRRTGIPYEMVAAETRSDYLHLIQEQDITVRLDSGYDFNEAERLGYKLTDSYFDSSISCLSLKTLQRPPKTVAAVRNSDFAEKYVQNTDTEEYITYYDSVEECLDAILEGRQDAAYFYTYTAQRLVFNDVRNRLKEVLIPESHTQFSIAVRQTEDMLLFSILNKAVRSLNKDEINKIIMEETAFPPRSFSMVGYFYDSPAAVVVLIILSALLVLVLFRRWSLRRNEKLELERVKEFERFITYVCRSNDDVLELDLDRETMFSYQVCGGKVIKMEELFIPPGTVEDLIHPEDWMGVQKIFTQESLNALICGGNEVYFECRLEWRKPGYQWCSCVFQGMQQDEMHPRSLMVFLKNIEESKHAEAEKKRDLQDALAAAQQASEAKGAFMSRMSHEIRTPMNAIIGYLSIASSNISNPTKVQDCLMKSELAAHHLLSIINDVLDISAIESGQMKIAQEAFDLKELLTEVAAIFYAQANNKEVRFDVALENLTQECLVGDQLRLKQILMNLLSNAVKFTQKGGRIHLLVSQKNIIGGKVHLQVEVSDTGIGMSEEYKKRLFMPFEQQDATTARKFGGTGLGLSITKNLITMMNGTISVKSEEEKGTCFKVSLSFGITETKEPGEGKIDFSQLYVLVLYDENSDCRYIRSLLDRCGVKSDIAFQEEEALELISSRKKQGQTYAMCLLDWNKPDLDGRRTAERIRKMCGPDMSVIICTSQEDAEIRECLVGAGINKVVHKPLFQSAMMDLLAETYGNHSREKDRGLEYLTVDLKGKRVLLAEDNEMNMEIATEILEGAGLVVEGAPNGREALDAFERSALGWYEVILMDIQMPVMDGYETSRKIRESAHPQAKNIPIIALTADAFTEDISRALMAGMNDHVSKPIDFRRLLEVLHKYTLEAQ